MAIFSSWFLNVCSSSFFNSSLPFILYSTTTFLHDFSVLSFNSSLFLLGLLLYCPSFYSSKTSFISFEEIIFSSFLGLPNPVYFQQVTWMHTPCLISTHWPFKSHIKWSNVPQYYQPQWIPSTAWTTSVMQNVCHKLTCTKILLAQSAGAVEYTDCTSAEG